MRIRRSVRIAVAPVGSGPAHHRGLSEQHRPGAMGGSQRRITSDTHGQGGLRRSGRSHEGRPHRPHLRLGLRSVHRGLPEGTAGLLGPCGPSMPSRSASWTARSSRTGPTSRRRSRIGWGSPASPRSAARPPPRPAPLRFTRPTTRSPPASSTTSWCLRGERMKMVTTEVATSIMSKTVDPEGATLRLHDAGAHRAHHPGVVSASARSARRTCTGRAGAADVPGPRPRRPEPARSLPRQARDPRRLLRYGAQSAGRDAADAQGLLTHL